MQEFTDREKKIILLMWTVANPITQNKPFEDKLQVLKVMLRKQNIEFNEKELTEIAQGIGKISSLSINTAFDIIRSMGLDIDLTQMLKMFHV